MIGQCEKLGRTLSGFGQLRVCSLRDALLPGHAWIEPMLTSLMLMLVVN